MSIAALRVVQTRLGARERGFEPGPVDAILAAER